MLESSIFILNSHKSPFVRRQRQGHGTIHVARPLSRHLPVLAEQDWLGAE